MRTKKYTRWAVIGVALLALILPVALASSQTSKIPRSSEAWSRGNVIGRTPVKQLVALRPAPSGGVFLIWQNLEKRFEMAHIGVDGEVLLNRVLPMKTKQARDPQLQASADGRLHLLWREGNYPHSNIHHVLLRADGTPVSQPQILSDPTIPVLDAPRLLRDVTGHYHAVWADETGIQWAVLNPEGTLLKTPTLLAPGGRFPAIQMDDQGRLHLAWRWLKRTNFWGIYYAALKLEDGTMGEPEELAEVFLRSGLRLTGPAIGLTPETGYVFWEVRDFSYVYSHAEFASFPLEFPGQRQVEPFGLWRAGNPSGIYPLAGLRTPLLAALSEHIPDPEAGEMKSQIVVFALEQRAREDVVTASSQASLEPVFIEDDRAHLHLAWLETAGFREYQVVYACTAPEVMENYNALTPVDVLSTVFSNVFRLSTLAVTLVGSLIIWISIPFVGLLVYHLVTSEETLAAKRARVAIIVALALEVALTFALPPSIGVDVTLSSLHWIVPAVSAVVTAVVTVRIVRRQHEAHLFGVFFLFTIVNSVLQTAMFLLL